MQQVPLAIFSCRTNSCPFQDRHISVHEPVKVGRSVARVRPAQNNAIFDCRVLSRNHALMWYENNKFYLQDTKSSNGTFVNNQRLSKASEESTPQDVCSGDTIQFGVDVMENSRTRVTHSCIIASVQLFHPDGSEARRDYNPFSHMSGGMAVQSQELYQLSQYLQEALHREQMLENKLSTLQRLVDSTQDASESGWQALIDEDRLLSKLEVLQNQLQVYSKNQTEDSLRLELTALQEDKYNYENTAKESLRKVLDEKLEAVRKLSELEASLGNTEEECTHLRQMCETSQKNLEELAQKHQDQLQEMASMHDKLQEADKQHKEEMETLSGEKEELWGKLQDMIKQESVLQAKVEGLQADNDFTKEQLANMRVKMDSIKETSHDSLRIPELISQGVQVEMVNLLHLQHLHGDSSTDDESEKDDNDVEMKDSGAKEVADALADLDLELDNQDLDDDSMNEKDLRDSLDALCELSQHPLDSSGVSDLSQHSLDSSRDMSLDESSGISTSRDQTDSDFDMYATLKPEKLKETQTSIEHYKKLLRESDTKQQESKAKIKQLQNELQAVRAESYLYVEKISSLQETLSSSESRLALMVEQATHDLQAQLDESMKQEDNHATLTSQLQQHIQELEVELDTTRSQSYLVEESEKQGVSPVPSSRAQEAGLKRELVKVKELLQESRTEHVTKDDEITSLKDRLSAANEQMMEKERAVQSLSGEVCSIQQQLKAKSTAVHELQDQLDRAELGTKEVKEQILVLRDHMVEETEHTKTLHEDGVTLQQQLAESQETAKQAKEEARMLKVKVEELQRRLNLSTNGTTLPPHDIPDALVTPDDFSSLREECGNLKKRIQVLEDDMKTYSQENRLLKHDNSTLRESHAEMQAIKDSLELQENVWRHNLTDSQKTKTEELIAANDDVSQLKDKCAEYKEEISVLNDSIRELADDYTELSFKSRVVSACSMLPLLVLLFAILLAFQPILSTITATTQPPG